MEFIVYTRPDTKDINRIRTRLQQYNRPFLEIDEEQTCTIEAHDDTGELAGGIVFTIFGQWLEIDFLWVDEKQRGLHLGSLLLDKAEQAARAQGCRMAYLTTFNFQARPFYEKHGFKVVYTQKNYPITNERCHMEKSL